MPVESVKIIGAQHVRSGKSRFTAYVLAVETPEGTRWEVRRRYSAFLLLHSQLQSAYDNVPPIPWKSALGSSHPWVVKERREHLDKFLQNCIGHPQLSGDRDFHEFLGFRVPGGSAPLAETSAPRVEKRARASAECEARTLKTEIAALEVDVSRLQATLELSPELQLDQYTLSLQRRLSSHTVLAAKTQATEEALSAALAEGRLGTRAAAATAALAEAEVARQRLLVDGGGDGGSGDGGDGDGALGDFVDGTCGGVGQGSAENGNGEGVEPMPAPEADVNSGHDVFPNGSDMHYKQELLLAESIIAEIKGHSCCLTDAGIGALHKQVRVASRVVDRPALFRKAHAALKLEMLSLPAIMPAQMPAGCAWRVSQTQIQQLVATRPLSLLRAMQALAVAYDSLSGDHLHMAALAPLSEVAMNGSCLRSMALAVAHTSTARNLAQGLLPSHVSAEDAACAARLGYGAYAGSCAGAPRPAAGSPLASPTKLLGGYAAETAASRLGAVGARRADADGLLAARTPPSRTPPRSKDAPKDAVKNETRRAIASSRARQSTDGDSRVAIASPPLSSGKRANLTYAQRAAMMAKQKQSGRNLE